MRTRKGAKESATTGETKTGTAESLDLADHALVVVFGGVTTMKKGPFTGEKTVSPVKVYLYGKQIGLLSRFELSQSSNQPLPEVDFTFPDEKVLERGSDSLRQSYEKYLTMVKEALPWATLNGRKHNVNVFDPGTVSPPRLPPEDE